MSRSTQFIGLNKRANSMLQSWNQEPSYDKDLPTFEPFDWLDEKVEKPVGNYTTGMFMEIIPLANYPDIDVIEKVQSAPWHSGPVIYTALWDTKKKEWLWDSLWSEEEMDII